MIYGKVVNGEIEYAPLDYTTEEGVVIHKFNSSEKLMNLYGFKRIVNERPSIKTNQTLVLEGYAEEETYIMFMYKVVNNNSDMLAMENILEQERNK